MKVIRQRLKPISIFTALFMLVISGPVQSASAAMIPTETLLESSQGQEARTRIKQLLVREDVRQALIKQGVDPLEADARLNSLTDAEVIQLADQIDQLPAGGDAVGLAIGVLVIVILVLVILRLL